MFTRAKCAAVIRIVLALIIACAAGGSLAQGGSQGQGKACAWLPMAELEAHFDAKRLLQAAIAR